MAWATDSGPIQSFMVEIFRTDVESQVLADEIVAVFSERYPSYQTNFDLDDPDRIFRVETVHPPISIRGVVRCMAWLGFSCERID